MEVKDYHGEIEHQNYKTIKSCFQLKLNRNPMFRRITWMVTHKFILHYHRYSTSIFCKSFIIL